MHLILYKLIYQALHSHFLKIFSGEMTSGLKQMKDNKYCSMKQKHSLDKLLMQFILCFYWMNPCFWLMRKELYLIHEFIADEHAVTDSNAAAFANMLLTTSFGKFNFLPAQSFFYSSIKLSIFCSVYFL